jgi:alpha-ribazole phosphatase
MRLLLARHGITDWNSDGRFQGQADIPMNSLGELQAQALGRRLAQEAFEEIFASDLARAVTTARLIAVYHSCPVVIDSRLREICFGKWEGLTYAEIAHTDPERLHAWETRDLQAAGPEGESLTQLAQRIQSFLDDLAKAHTEGTILIVSHGGALNVMLCLLLGMSPSQYWQFRLAQASLTEVAFAPGKTSLVHLNDTCHL